MRVPLSWLREFVDVDLPHRLRAAPVGVAVGPRRRDQQLAEIENEPLRRHRLPRAAGPPPEDNIVTLRQPWCLTPL